MSNCLSMGCYQSASPALKRGLCLTCYSRAKCLVESGTTTWAELVELCLVLPSDAEGDGLFTQAFNEAKRKNKQKDNCDPNTQLGKDYAVNQ